LSVLDDVAAAARAKWIQLARSELFSSKRDYIDGIQPVAGEGNERFIALVGQLPNMIEQGVEAYDLRDTLLGPNAKNVRTSKSGGRYRPIPFRHGTPDSQGQVGTPMGSRYGPQGSQSLAWSSKGLMSSGEAAQLGKAVYKAAKALKGRARLGGKSGQTTVAKGKSMIQVPKLAPWHSTDIYAGMKKVRKRYEKATQSQYITFRTISDTNSEGWIHTGIVARQLHQRVESEIQEMMNDIVANAVSVTFGSGT